MRNFGIGFFGSDRMEHHNTFDGISPNLGFTLGNDRNYHSNLRYAEPCRQPPSTKRKQRCVFFGKSFFFLNAPCSTGPFIGPLGTQDCCYPRGSSFRWLRYMVRVRFWRWTETALYGASSAGNALEANDLLLARTSGRWVPWSWTG